MILIITTTTRLVPKKEQRDLKLYRPDESYFVSKTDVFFLVVRKQTSLVT